MKQPYLLQTSPNSLILFDNGKDNFLADFHQAFSVAKLKANMKIYLPCLARMLFYRERRAAGLGGLGRQNLFLPSFLPFPLDLADGCGVMPVGTPEPVAAERLQARFADKNDNAGLSQPFLILPLKTVGNHAIVLLCASACSTNRSKSV